MYSVVPGNPLCPAAFCKPTAKADRGPSKTLQHASRKDLFVCNNSDPFALSKHGSSQPVAITQPAQAAVPNTTTT